MIVYALVGSSGTGKSFQATNLCKQKGIEAIIDDGLLIHQGEVKAGQSAKREATKIGAVKTALFVNEDHRLAVSTKIKQENLEKILLLGTSIGMVERIAERLELPKISNFIFIEDITTEKERTTAKKERGVHGKHVVPVPAGELKKQFSGYFLNPLRIFKDFNSSSEMENEEKTEVRPTFSYMGEFQLSEKVMHDIIVCMSTETKAKITVQKVFSEETKKGMIVTILLLMEYQENIMREIEEIQKQAFEILTYMTDYNIIAVNIELRDIDWGNKGKIQC